MNNILELQMRTLRLGHRGFEWLPSAPDGAAGCPECPGEVIWTESQSISQPHKAASVSPLSVRGSTIQDSTGQVWTGLHPGSSRCTTATQLGMNGWINK